jgi:L-arabinose isomerase
MLEICESIADGKPSLEVHPLGIGGKERPGAPRVPCSRWKCDHASIMDLSNRFRLLVNEVDVVKPAQPLPKLPVGRAVWECRPCLKLATRLGRL